MYVYVCVCAWRWAERRHDSGSRTLVHTHQPTRLRSGKAQTVSYQKEDFNRIFGPNGTGFSRAGRYGTNALYTWRTRTAQAADGVDGVEGTMKLYLSVRL